MPTLPPVNNTLDPVILPEDFNLRLLLEDRISSEDKTNPPISPPVKSTREPVISPVSLKIKLLLELDIAFEVIANPPIVPNVAVIPPCRYTLSVASPNPGLDLLNTISEFANPDKSPNLAFNCMS